MEGVDADLLHQGRDADKPALPPLEVEQAGDTSRWTGEDQSTAPTRRISEIEAEQDCSMPIYKVYRLGWEASSLGLCSIARILFETERR